MQACTQASRNTTAGATDPTTSANHPAPTFYAQQGAAAALQVEQHLLAKGVVGLDLRQAGQAGQGRAGISGF